MAEIGQYSLIFALVISAAGIVAGIVAGVTRHDGWTQVAQRSVWVVLALSSISMAALFYALYVGDFRLAYVAQHSARDMPLGYRMAALWGGQAGSLLLWGWMVALYGSAALWFNRNTTRNLTPWVSFVV